MLTEAKVLQLYSFNSSFQVVECFYFVDILSHFIGIPSVFERLGIRSISFTCSVGIHSLDSNTGNKLFRNYPIVIDGGSITTVGRFKTGTSEANINPVYGER